MSNINKKHTSLAVLAVVFATAMIASVIADDNAFAKQVISQKNKLDQSSSCPIAAAASAISCGGNSAEQTQTNNGGNARN